MTFGGISWYFYKSSQLLVEFHDIFTKIQDFWWNLKNILMGFHDLQQKKYRYSGKIQKNWWLRNCEIVNRCDIGKPKKLIHLKILVVEEIANSFLEATKKELMTSTGSCLNSKKSVLVEIANSFMEAAKTFDEFDRIREVRKGKTYLAWIRKSLSWWWNWKSSRLEKKKLTMPDYKKIVILEITIHVIRKIILGKIVIVRLEIRKIL